MWLIDTLFFLSTYLTYRSGVTTDRPSFLRSTSPPLDTPPRYRANPPPLPVLTDPPYARVARGRRTPPTDPHQVDEARTSTCNYEGSYKLEFPCAGVVPPSLLSCSSLTCRRGVAILIAVP